MFETLNSELVNPPSFTYADRTYRTRRSLRRFLATLTPAQLAHTEVMVDDENFVVFYPVISGNQARHFDTGENSGFSQEEPETLDEVFALEGVAVV